MIEHGTRGCYQAGCRRADCIEANTIYAQQHRAGGTPLSGEGGKSRGYGRTFPIAYSVLFENPPWVADAACATYQGRDVWFPERGPRQHQDIAAARTICDACPVRVDCLNYAVANRIDQGVWGGLTWPQRRALVAA